MSVSAKAIAVIFKVVGLFLCILLVVSPLLLPDTVRAAPSGVTVNRYFCQWHSTVTTNSTSLARIESSPGSGYYPLELTFTPPATAYYLVIAHARISNANKLATTSLQFLYNSTEIDQTHFTPRENGDYLPQGFHRVIELTGSTSYTFAMKFKTSNASYTASINDGDIMVMLLGGASGDYYNSFDSATYSYSTDTNWSTVMTYQFTPPSAGYYLVIGSASTTIASQNTLLHMQLTLGAGDTSQGEVVKEISVAGEYRRYSIIRLINFANEQQTLKIQHKTENTSNAVSSKNIGITAVKLSTIGINGYTADVAGSSATSTTYTPVTDAALSGTPSQYGCYLVMTWALFGGNSILYKVYNEMVIDEMGHGEMAYRPDDTSDRQPAYDTNIAVYGPFLHTARIDHKADSGAQVTTSNARLIAFQLNTLESYRDAGVNQLSTFDATYHTVYIYGYGYHYDYEDNQGESYHIAFYDHNGTQVASVAGTSAYNRSINALYNLAGTSGVAGTWHAVVYKDTVQATGKADSGSTTTLVDSARTEADDYWNGWTLEIVSTTDGGAPQGESKTVTDFVASTDTITVSSAFSAAIDAGDVYRLYKSISPATTYTASDANSFIEVAFTVEASAIPEFPTVIASLAVVGACFGIYYRLRKGKVENVEA